MSSKSNKLYVLNNLNAGYCTENTRSFPDMGNVVGLTFDRLLDNLVYLSMQMTDFFVSYIEHREHFVTTSGKGPTESQNGRSTRFNPWTA